MIHEEKITKDGQGISRRMNELGVKLENVRFFDWNPMFVIMIYEVPDATDATRRAAQLEDENAKMREQSKRA